MADPYDMFHDELDGLVVSHSANAGKATLMAHALALKDLLGPEGPEGAGSLEESVYDLVSIYDADGTQGQLIAKAAVIKARHVP